MAEDNQISISAELVRKGIHLTALTIPVGYSLVSFPVAILGVTAGAVVALVLDISRFRKWRLWTLAAIILTPIIRDHEFKGGLTGASYILTTSALTIAISNLAGFSYSFFSGAACYLAIAINAAVRKE